MLSVVGDIDLATAPRLVSHAADAIRHGARALVLDLRAVPFVDSAGLAALLNVLRRASAVNGDVVLAEVQPQVRRLLHDTRVEQHFAIAETVQDAERRLSDAA